MNKDVVATKLALGELTLEDLLPILRKVSVIIATHEDNEYITNTYDSWNTRTTFTVTNSDGETEEEQEDNGDFTLFNIDKEGPTFKLKNKIKLQGNRIYATDDDFQKYILELHREFDLQKLLLKNDH